MKPYKIIFCSSSGFGVPSLELLAKSSFEIVCVVTRPDNKKGRHLKKSETEIKKTATSLGLKIYQPEDINSKESFSYLKDLNSDLFVVISYGQILKKSILNIPKIFCVNAHASILPKYRGAAPISWALINGEKETGVSIIKMEEKMDAGPIIYQSRIDIQDEDNVITLGDKLSKLASHALITSLNSIVNDKCQLEKQDERLVSLAPILKKQDGLINWHLSAQEIANRVRGLYGWPGSFTYFKSRLLKIYEVVVVKDSTAVSDPQNSLPITGEITDVSEKGILVGCKWGYLLIKKLQLEGSKVLVAKEFIQGHNIKPGDRLGK